MKFKTGPAVILVIAIFALWTFHAWFTYVGHLVQCKDVDALVTPSPSGNVKAVVVEETCSGATEPTSTLEIRDFPWNSIGTWMLPPAWKPVVLVFKGRRSCHVDWTDESKLRIAFADTDPAEIRERKSYFHGIDIQFDFVDSGSQ
jgi:hypothetical protein